MLFTAPGSPTVKSFCMYETTSSALKVAGGTCAKVLTADEVVAYMQNDFTVGEPGAVKGKAFPDGRKD